MRLRPYRDIARHGCRRTHVRKRAVGGDAPNFVPSMAKTRTQLVKTTGERIGRPDDAGADIVRVSREIEAGSVLQDQWGAGKRTKIGRPLSAVS